MNKEIKERTYVLKKKAAPLSYILRTRHSSISPLLYFDEKNGVSRALRYASNQKSPFEDEQDGNAILTPVIFENGFLRVSAQNQVLQKFLECHPYNGIVFEELDRSKSAQEELEAIDVEFSAIEAVKNMSISELEKVARIVLGKNVSKMSTAEMKRDVMVYARRNPYEFISVIDDPEVETMSTAMAIFENGLLSFRNNRKEIFYNLPDNKKRLLIVPTGKDPMEHLVGFFKSSDGDDVYQKLKDLMD